MKAVIVAAGKSSRLYPLTRDKPKCLLNVGGMTILERAIRSLYSREINEICIVVGCMREKIIKAFGKELTYIYNPFYEITNDMASLWFSKEFVSNSPFIYFHSDLLFDQRILDICLKSRGSIVMVYDPDELNEESMKVEIDSDGHLVRSSKDIPLSRAAGEWIGMIKFDSEGGSKMFLEIEKCLEESNFNAYDTLALTNLAKNGQHIITTVTDGYPWIEVDSHEDLTRAREIFL